MSEYRDSVDLLLTDPAAAAELIVEAGIFNAAPVAQKAIPNCNLCFISSTSMENALSKFLEVMHGFAPASIGGAVPGEDFYYDWAGE